ncbi:unnamed protein product, partial [Trichobilharzia regenti]
MRFCKSQPLTLYIYTFFLKVNLFTKLPFGLIKRQLSNKTHICIIGSGPSAFYTAQTLLKNHAGVHIDMFEKLPAPFGLVRYGVAPDHPEVKVLSQYFSSTFKLIKECHKYLYRSCLWRCCRPDIPGVLSAKDLVGWYNGAPNNVNVTSFPRILTPLWGWGMLPSMLHSTEIPEPVISCLSNSRVRKVVLIGRRG